MGGFDLSKWKANHSDLLEKNDDGSPGEVEDKIVKILGVHWNPLEDAFRFTMDVEEFKLPAQTPRQLVGVQCSLFDPQGFIAPFIFLGRKSLQLSMRDRKGWDSPLTEELKEKFFQWATSIPILRGLRHPALVEH